jgi:hypothetical protein
VWIGGQLETLDVKTLDTHVSAMVYKDTSGNERKSILLTKGLALTYRGQDQVLTEPNPSVEASRETMC